MPLSTILFTSYTQWTNNLFIRHRHLALMLILRILTQMLIHRKPTIIVVTGPIPTSSRSCPGTNFINEDQYYII